jgi:hypothetical protein
MTPAPETGNLAAISCLILPVLYVETPRAAMKFEVTTWPQGAVTPARRDSWRVGGAVVRHDLVRL